MPLRDLTRRRKDAEDSLRIAFWGGLCILFALRTVSTFAADTDVFVRVNQLGFQPAGVKTAIAFGRSVLPTKFQLIDAATQKVAFEAESQPIEESWGEFKHHAELQFTVVR